MTIVFSINCHFIMNRFTPEERLLIVETYFQNHSSVKSCYRALRPHFGRHNRPTESTIRAIITKFRTKSTLLDIPPTRVRRARNSENIAAVAESVREDPDQSIRRRSQGLGISYGTLWRILKRENVADMENKKSRRRPGKLDKEKDKKEKIVEKNDKVEETKKRNSAASNDGEDTNGDVPVKRSRGRLPKGARKGGASAVTTAKLKS